MLLAMTSIAAHRETAPRVVRSAMRAMMFMMMMPMMMTMTMMMGK